MTTVSSDCGVVSAGCGRRRIGRRRQRTRRHAGLLRRRSAGGARRRRQGTRLDVALRRARRLLRRCGLLVLWRRRILLLTRIPNRRRLRRESGHAAGRPRRRIVVENTAELRLRLRRGNRSGSRPKVRRYGPSKRCARLFVARHGRTLVAPDPTESPVSWFPPDGPVNTSNKAFPGIGRTDGSARSGPELALTDFPAPRPCSRRWPWGGGPAPRSSRSAGRPAASRSDWADAAFPRAERSPVPASAARP